MANKNKNRNDANQETETKFVGIALNRDSEPVVVTEDGKIYIVRDVGGKRKWTQFADYAADQVE